MSVLKKLLAALFLVTLAVSASAAPGDVAVYFGSFDPFHEGHLAVVRGALPDLGVDRVLVIPTPDTRKKENHATYAERLGMVRAAAFRYKELQGPSSELVQHIREGGRDWKERVLGHLYKQLPPNALVQEIVGMDRFHAMLGADMIPPKREPRMIIVVDRPGHPVDTELLSRKRVAPGKILFLHPEVLDVQSSAVRAAVKAGKDIYGKVPNVVRKLIETWKLYR